MIRRPPRATRTDTPFPYTTLFRSLEDVIGTPCDYAMLPDRPLPAAEIVTRAAAPLERATALEDVIGTPCDYAMRSEEHTSELQSLMRISYAVFCLKKKKQTTTDNISIQQSTRHKR